MEKPQRLLWSRYTPVGWLLGAGAFAVFWMLGTYDPSPMTEVYGWLMWVPMSWLMVLGLEALLFSGIWAQGGYLKLVHLGLIPARQALRFDKIARITRKGKPCMTRSRYSNTEYQAAYATSFTVHLLDQRAFPAPTILMDGDGRALQQPIWVEQSKRRGFAADGPIAFRRIAWDVVVLRVAVPLALLMWMHPWGL